MAAYYNEHDEQKAAWLRELIRRNVIADGEVDERDIKLVQPEDLRGFAQCHFFAGVGVWSYALRLARWPDDRECWTGSCPCPSFSAAGQGKGFDDARHLWPDWVRLIRIGKPSVIFGEQADDAIGYGWLDLVQTDLEAEAYAVGKAVLGACSVGGSDIRQRLYWMANSTSATCERNAGRVLGAQAPISSEDRSQHGDMPDGFSYGVSAGRLGNTDEQRLQGGTEERVGPEGRQAPQRPTGLPSGASSGLANAESSGWRICDSENEWAPDAPCDTLADSGNRAADRCGPDAAHPATDALKGFWRDSDWLFCTDGFWRPVEAGTFPLAHGAPCRLGRLRGYGDAINAEVAKVFIEESWEAVTGHSATAGRAEQSLTG